MKMKCKFCGCTDERACAIPMRLVDDKPMFALAGQVSTFTAACYWIAPRICSSPACVDKAFKEASLLADQLAFFIERQTA